MAEIQLQAIIGEGEFGTVYKGTYNGVSKINVFHFQITEFFGFLKNI